MKLPAEATKYKIEKLAEADLQRVVLEAEAKAEAVKVCLRSKYSQPQIFKGTDCERALTRYKCC